MGGEVSGFSLTSATSDDGEAAVRNRGRNPRPVVEAPEREGRVIGNLRRGDTRFWLLNGRASGGFGEEERKAEAIVGPFHCISGRDKLVDLDEIILSLTIFYFLFFWVLSSHPESRKKNSITHKTNTMQELNI